MSKIFQRFLLLAICLGSCEKLLAQGYADWFYAWKNKSIGGGGFCLEIRFDPYDLYRPAGSPPTLYLVTDVSGLYRSTDLGGTWSQFWHNTNNPDQLTRYLTTIAFNNTSGRVIVGSRDGIFYAQASTIGPSWTAAAMPDRNALASQGITMATADGLYPWIGIIREYPHDHNKLLAGIGEVREFPNNPPPNKTAATQFGLSALLRSTDGGVNWELIQIPLAVAERSDPIIYDIDYVTDENNVIHTFMSAGHVIKTTNSLGVTSCTYHGGIFYSDNVFAATPAWKNIAKEKNLGAPLTNVVSLALLTKNANSILEVSDLEIRLYASRHVVSNETVDGGVYESFTTLADLAASATPQLTWTNVRSGHRFFQLGVKPGSTKDNHEIFVGKRHGEEIDLRARSVTPSVITNFARIVDPENTSLNNDNGYRELEPKNGVQNTQLKFGSFDFNPDRTSETYAHPTVYGCWGYGPLKAEGHNSNFNTARAYEQIFTTNTAGGNDGTWVSRGIMDEVFFNGPTAAFHPTNPNIVLIGCGDNGLLRTETINDFTAKWYQNRLIPAENWYGGDNQFVYHLAFHPLNANIVIAAAGTDNHRPAITGKGGLLKNTASGAGTAASWSMIAGGPGGSNGLPDAEIQSFIFDEKEGFKDGLFVAVRNHGIYYGKINSSGTIILNFQKIVESELLQKIPLARAINEPWDTQHSYSRIIFDSGNSDILYVARHWPAVAYFASHSTAREILQISSLPTVLMKLSRAELLGMEIVKVRISLDLLLTMTT